MRSHLIDIYEFPFHLGLRRKEYEREPGVVQLPDWLRTFGLHERLHAAAVFRLDPPAYSMQEDKQTGMLNTSEIITYAIKQANLLGEQLRLDNGRFKLVIGGDCSILIGNALALKQQGTYGLAFVDGHTDYITRKQSTTGAAAGMDLAIVTGLGDERLTNLQKQKPYFHSEHVFCMGNREFDADYVRPILESKVHYFDLSKLRSESIQSVSENFLQMVEQQKLDGFWIHLDVDVLDDQLMPAVDSRAAGGLDYEELTSLLKPLIASPKALGMEITILDPTLDQDGRYTAPFVDWLVDILGK